MKRRKPKYGIGRVLRCHDGGMTLVVKREWWANGWVYIGLDGCAVAEVNLHPLTQRQVGPEWQRRKK